MEANISKVVNNLFSTNVSAVLTRPDEQFGDYATNVALQLAKPLGRDPREIAEDISKELKQNSDFSKVSVAGPGFINMRLSDVALIKAAELEPAKIRKGENILVEYSDPNPFKPLHAGHLYTTLVGDSISRLLEVAGANVTRLNYGGDVGLHVAKAMWAIIKYLGGEHPEKLAEIPESNRPAWLGDRYVEGNTAYEDDDSARAEIIEINKKIYAVQADDGHETDFSKIYWTGRQWSYDYFKDLYEQLEVKPFDRYIPESEVTPLGFSTVKEQLGNGVYTESDGAIVYEGEQDSLHTRVFINSEGLPTYEAKDVGLSLTKWRDYKFDESIIITANEQSEYMKVVIASIMRFAPEPAKRTRHLTHGMVKLEGGVKMSSRKGNTVTAVDILESARKAASESQHDTTESTVLAAIKYAFVKNRIGGDIVYDPKESVALEGNSGPYLQYAHARARSILAKSNSEPQKPTNLESGERSLLRKLGEYSEVVEKASRELMPHYVAVYLYELAQAFNSFYENNRVIGEGREAERLWLVERYSETLESGLGLFGIDAPQSM